MDSLGAAPMEYISYFTQLGLVLMALIALPFLVLVFLRSRKLPQCYSCGARKMRLSREVSVLDRFLGTFQIQPYRCEGCRERFHALRLFGDSKKPVVQRQRVVKVVFRFRNGLPNRVAIRVIDRSREPAAESPAMLQT
jgi:hypothetical protein